MYSNMAGCLDRLDRDRKFSQSILEWGCPVPYFGEIGLATVATVGINPSDREFVDSYGRQLDGRDRRFPTRQHLGLDRWSMASSQHVRAIVKACSSYFSTNPYTRWFDVLEEIVGACGVSFYPYRLGACHVDLVPFATPVKWSELPSVTQRHLLSANASAVASVIRDSDLMTLILNGRSVVRQFQALSGVDLLERRQSSWDLPRASGSVVFGKSYEGQVEEIGGITLGRTVRVIGYNHNLQSSFGVTRSTIASISSWVSGMVRG
jgi:hypothetical protein